MQYPSTFSFLSLPPAIAEAVDTEGSASDKDRGEGAPAATTEEYDIAPGEVDRSGGETIAGTAPVLETGADGVGNVDGEDCGGWSALDTEGPVLTLLFCSCCGGMRGS